MEERGKQGGQDFEVGVQKAGEVYLHLSDQIPELQQACVSQSRDANYFF